MGLDEQLGVITAKWSGMETIFEQGQCHFVATAVYGGTSHIPIVLALRAFNSLARDGREFLDVAEINELLEHRPVRVLAEGGARCGGALRFFPCLNRFDRPQIIEKLV